MSNETTIKLADLKVGDTAVIRYRGRHDNEILTVVTVTKILPNGKIKTRTPGSRADRIWSSDGHGKKYGSENLRALADGETAETIAADKQAKAEKIHAKAAAERVEHTVKTLENKETTMKTKWEKVGMIGVDAGLCWIGDPCYCVTPDARDHPAKTWQKFCDRLHAREKNGVTQWYYDTGIPGLGVSVSTGYGDGVYPVSIRRNAEGRITEVRVKFIEED